MELNPNSSPGGRLDHTEMVHQRRGRDGLELRKLFYKGWVGRMRPSLLIDGSCILSLSHAGTALS